MIANAKSGSGFKGAVGYAAGKADAEFICSNIGGKDSAHDARLMAAIADTGNCAKPVLHVSLSLAPGEKLRNDQWEKVALRYEELMGLTENHQHVVVKHNDAKNEHIHIILNKVDAVNSKTFSTFKLYQKQTKAMRTIEKEFGLSSPTSFNHQQRQSPSTQGKFADLRKGIDSAINKSNCNYGNFKIELAEKGIKVIENKSPTTGRVSGISYQEIGESKFHKGSAIGKDYSVNGLQARGLLINAPTPVSHPPTLGQHKSYPHPTVPTNFSWAGEIVHGHHGRGEMTIEDMRQMRKAKERARASRMPI